MYIGDDFVAERLDSLLFPGATRRCINIGVINDNTALEGNEMFSVVLATVFFPVPIDISIAQVTIVDTDCKYSLSRLLFKTAPLVICFIDQSLFYIVQLLLWDWRGQCSLFRRV